ncbi:uncharacterized protein LOC113364222 isoform X1 [Ctenocephalides felis]|uniref:uncharacterized protein LOC113364222 isoform X1 n=1 Tax=Ctenocephalides felis TaxID=7515 RepID=UPI000E6E4FE8|nr:uncharacterized protein LOC113364222 isoform X1 [Ctenocephalides felis]
MSTDMESATLRQRLEAAEGALKLQTIRCCQLVTEYTGKLQRKDEQLCCEQQLRERQLSYVLQALRLFEERLQREQKSIRQLLLDKDNVISSQKGEILKLRSIPEDQTELDNKGKQYCDNCQVMFDAQNALMSNLKVSEVEMTTTASSGEDCSTRSETSDVISVKNSKDLTRNVRRSKKYSAQRKNGDGRRQDPIPPFSSSSDEQDDRSIISKEEEVGFRRQPSFSNWVDSLHGIKQTKAEPSSPTTETVKSQDTIIENNISLEVNITNNQESLTTNDDTKIDENWYTNTSDAEDSNIPEIYKDNPVLECVNQILLQNSRDANSSEDSSPKLSSKRVQFAAQDTILKPPPAPKGIISNHSKSSENSPKSPKMVKFNLEAIHSDRDYESPADCFNYEIQSIYSNDYEAIINRNAQCSLKNSTDKFVKLEKENHHYVDMDTTKSKQEKIIPKLPPALPPKPPNLISKYKIHKNLERTKMSSDVVECVQQINDAVSDIPEPDYCSISEISEQVAVVPLIKPNMTTPRVIEAQLSVQEPDIPVVKVAPVTRLQTINLNHLLDSADSEDSSYVSVDAIKLPEVSEIIIPKEDRYDHDNYIKNNSALLKTSKSSQDEITCIIPVINKLKPEIVNKTPSDIVNNNDNACKSNVLHTFENLDLSQTFEEFKLDEDDINGMEVEEYVIEDNQDFVFHESDENEQPNAPDEIIADKVETFYNLSKSTLLATQFMRSQLIPDDSLELMDTVIKEKEDSIKSMSESDNDIIEHKNLNGYPHHINKNYESFLETSGLSSKSIQNLYKVNNMHLRIGGKPISPMKPGTTVKYWSGPYL